MDAAWPAIVPEDVFYNVQRLLQENEKTHTNQVRKTRQTYVFLHGLLKCGVCQSPLEGRSGTARSRQRYYYYICKAKSGKVRIAAPEIELVVLDRIRELASQPNIHSALVTATNEKLRTEIPRLKEQEHTPEKERADVQAEAEALMK